MKLYLKVKPFAAIHFAMALAACSQQDMMEKFETNTDIIACPASVDTRSAIDGAPDGNGVAGMLWTVGDVLGVFENRTGTQFQYIKANDSKEPKSVFKAVGEGTASPRYAYYPYSDANNGLAPNNLKGNVPATQPMDDGTVAGDYKYGTANTTTSAGTEFEFRHLFSLVKVDIDASGTELAGETLKCVEITVARNGSPVNITGDFTFSAVSGTYDYGADLHNSLVMAWEKGKTLNGTITGYVSLFPEIRKGDEFTFTVTTDKHQAKFSAVSKIDFLREYIYNFPVTMANRDGITVTELPSTDPTVKSGTFTCATYNVDGLPSTVNIDGPGSSGTTTLGQYVNNNANWDFFCVSEDFEYDNELTAALTKYEHGTYRGNIGAGQVFGQVADTDGLNMFWTKNKGIKVTEETFVEYNDKVGGLKAGANTCIKKGFRYYLVTMPDGTEIDVYITHMNTFSGSDISESNKYVAAVHSQLKQVRDYMLDNMKKNKRPAIFMGDTNMRYTRHRLQEYFMDYINSLDGYSVVDPWISLTWNNDFTSEGGAAYPLYGGKSLMVSDATGTNADTDVIISESDGGLQKGEVVDKVFYINSRDAKTQLKAKNYLRDISFKKDNGKPLADHYPIVVEFEYTTE